MTDLLSQAKKQFLTAKLAYQEASDALDLAMKELETAKKQRAEAQKAFESKTLNYSLAIQNASNLETQPYLSEKALIATNHDLEVTKKEYEAAQGINQAQEAISQTAFYTVVQAQAIYDTAKLEYESADYAYSHILQERKLPLLGELKSPTQTEPETPTENIDFLMQFLSSPLPDYEGTDSLTDEQQVTDINYDTSLPFEKRPAIEKPPSIEEPQPTLETSNTGHITWYFDFPVPHNDKNEMENKTDD